MNKYPAVLVLVLLSVATDSYTILQCLYHIDEKREWMNELINEWMNEWMDEWMNEWMNVNEWMNEWMSDWLTEWRPLVSP